MPDDPLSRLTRLAATYPTAGVQLVVGDAVAEIERLRDDNEALAAAMPSEGADAAIGYSAMKRERDALAAEVERLRDCISARQVRAIVDERDAARRERDDWQALCAATGCDLEAMRRERNALAELLREARPFLWSSLGRSVDAVLGKEQP